MQEQGRINALARVRRPTLAASVKASANSIGGEILIVLEAGESRDPDVRAMARVQDEGSGYLPGGEIRPRYAKYLAIPLAPAKAAGQDNTPWHLHPKAEVKLWRMRSRDGYVVTLGGVAYYLLVRSVVLKGTRYLMDAFTEGAADMIRTFKGGDVRLFLYGAPGLTVPT
ncbi:MAG: hypothetical protein ACO3PB_04625 [Miltoncostaeaceae bacterium]